MYSVVVVHEMMAVVGQIGRPQLQILAGIAQRRGRRGLDGRGRRGRGRGEGGGAVEPAPLGRQPFLHVKKGHLFEEKFFLQLLHSNLTCDKISEKEKKKSLINN